jgi:hypothetical protein
VRLVRWGGWEVGLSEGVERCSVWGGLDRLTLW